MEYYLNNKSKNPNGRKFTVKKEQSTPNFTSEKIADSFSKTYNLNPLEVVMLKFKKS